MRKLIAAAAIVAVGVGVGGTAFAGEQNGSGQGGVDGEGRTGAYYNSNSECAFSGLEDGSEPGTVAGPGNAQNWGQIPKEVRDSFGGFNPGEGCNGHTAGRN